ncbi:MAG: hypothetical protein IJL31_00175 [Oscillospiraceae bacterium]|nr:hypothetical protein [Oscillospiraceae bacterium]
MPKQIAAICVLLAVATGCGLCKHIPTEVNIKDSTVVNYVDSTVISIKDSTVFVQLPAEESSAVLPDGYHSHVQTSIAESDAWVSDGLLHHTIRNRSDYQLPVVVPITTTATVIRQDSDHTGLTQRTVIKEVERKLTWWQRFRIGSFFWLLALAIIGWRRELMTLLTKILIR